MRAALRPALAAGLLVCLAVGGAAHADETGGPGAPADPREGPAGADGLTPVSGSNEGATAPTVASGRYVDTAPSLDRLRIYRFERTLPESTLAFGLTMLGDEVDPRRRPVLRLFARVPDRAAGERRVVVCGVARVDDTDKATVMPVSSIGGWSYRSKPLCESATELFVAVRNTVTPVGADRARLLVPEGAPYELDLWEQPAVTNADALKQAFDDSWVYDDAGVPTVRAEPGLSPSSAVPLTAGKTAAVNLPLGRVAWFAVPVALGQHLQVLVETADGAAAAGAGFESRVYSPVGGSVVVADPTSDLPAAAVGNLAAGPFLLSAVTGEVDPGNRTDNEGSAYSQHSALAAAAGHYLVAVYVQRLTGARLDTLPVTIRTRLDDRRRYPGDGYTRPVYASPVTSFPAPTGPRPTAYVADRISSSPVPERGRSAADWILVGGLGAAAVVFAGAGALLLRRRRT